MGLTKLSTLHIPAHTLAFLLCALLLTYLRLFPRFALQYLATSLYHYPFTIALQGFAIQLNRQDGVHPGISNEGCNPWYH